MSVLPHCSPSVTVCIGAGANGTIISVPEAAFRGLSPDFPQMSPERGHVTQAALIRSSATLQVPSGRGSGPATRTTREALPVVRDRDRDSYQRGRDQYRPEDDRHVAQ